MTNDGILGVYKLTNTAAAGYMPQMQLVKLFDAYYSRMRVGVTRLYAAIGVNAQVDGVFRLWNTRIGEAMPKDLYAVADNIQYRITLAQDVVERDAVDITVQKIDDLFTIAEEENVTDSNDSSDEAEEPG